ncbi:MAG: hypothetical protein LBK94_04980 [Prevotellaceae bacterium]|jgi:hypothetical protein|nr:hypothetical protein [Prevotellaceae bacterium]
MLETLLIIYLSILFYEWRQRRKERRPLSDEQLKEQYREDCENRVKRILELYKDE